MQTSNNGFHTKLQQFNRRYPIILHSWHWLLQIDHFFIIVILYSLSTLCGIILPRYLVDITQSGYKVPELNSGVITHCLGIGLAVYLIVNGLNQLGRQCQPDQHQKHRPEVKTTLIDLIKILTIAIPLITIDVTNNLVTKPMINNQYEAGVSNNAMHANDEYIITTTDGQTYHLNADHYIENDHGHQQQSQVKLLYNQPIEIIYPKE